MLRRIHIKGYKSLDNLDVTLSPLTLLFGPNASGKSNFLDALQLLSRMATSRTLREAFEPPYRGKPLESFTMGDGGIEGLIRRERLTFSIEADLELSNSLVEAVNREIQEMRRPSGDSRSSSGGNTPGRVRERNLRYRVEIEMAPRSGVLRVSDEYLAALNARGEPTGSRKPFLEAEGDKLTMRLEGQSHPTGYDRYMDRTILSLPHYPPHYPHLTAARRELESWLFFYFEPRERMRATGPVKEVRHIGLMGEELAAHLNTLKANNPRQFEAIEKGLHLLLPNAEGIQVEVSNLGEVELALKENSVAVPARVLSEGTLRLLGLLALAGSEEPPSLVGFEEPENGVHPGKIDLVAEFLKTRHFLGTTQYIVTTHSPRLLDTMSPEFLYSARRKNRKTHIDPLRNMDPLWKRLNIRESLETEEPGLTISQMIIRGDFDD
jgi:predicted ATPase